MVYLFHEHGMKKHFEHPRCSSDPFEAGFSEQSKIP